MASLKQYLMQGGKYVLVSLLPETVLSVPLLLQPWKKRELSNRPKPAALSRPANFYTFHPLSNSLKKKNKSEHFSALWRLYG